MSVGFYGKANWNKWGKIYDLNLFSLVCDKFIESMQRRLLLVGDISDQKLRKIHGPQAKAIILYGILFAPVRTLVFASSFHFYPKRPYFLSPIFLFDVSLPVFCSSMQCAFIMM